MEALAATEQADTKAGEEADRPEITAYPLPNEYSHISCTASLPEEKSSSTSVPEIGERLRAYLERHGWPEEYEAEDLLEHYPILDWLAVQLSYSYIPRKIDNLLIYGRVNQATQLLFAFNKVLRIHFADSNSNLMSEASNQDDLWLFQLKEEEGSEDYVQSLCQVIDGKKNCHKLDKEQRVPVLLLAQSIPKALRKPGPLQERFIRLPLKNPMEDLSEERLIATLFGCVKRRRSAVPQKANQLNQAPAIPSSPTMVKIIDYVLKNDRPKWSAFYEIESLRPSVVCTDEGEFLTKVLYDYTLNLDYVYGSEIKDQFHFPRPKDYQGWEAPKYIAVDIRENTLFMGGPTVTVIISLCYHSVRKKKGANQKETKNHQSLS